MNLPTDDDLLKQYYARIANVRQATHDMPNHAELMELASRHYERALAIERAMVARLRAASQIKPA